MNNKEIACNKAYELMELLCDIDDIVFKDKILWALSGLNEDALIALINDVKEEA